MGLFKRNNPSFKINVLCAHSYLADTPPEKQMGGNPRTETIHRDAMETTDNAVNF